MKEFIKKNFAILLAFALPILLIIVVAITTYLPSVSVSTKYNFVYTVCSDGSNYYPYNCKDYLQKRFSILNGKLAVNAIDPKEDLNNNKIPDEKEHIVRIFLHDTEKNESMEISLDEARAFNFRDLITSPDGVSVSNDYSYNGRCDFFFFGGCSGSSYEYYLKKGDGQSKLNLINSGDRYYYQNNFQFLGWVLPPRS